MTKTEAKPAIVAVNELFAKSPDGLREIVRAVVQEMLEAEMTDALGAEKGERTSAGPGAWKSSTSAIAAKANTPSLNAAIRPTSPPAMRL